MSDKRTGKKTRKVALSTLVAGDGAVSAEAPAVSTVKFKAKKSHRK